MSLAKRLEALERSSGDTERHVIRVIFEGSSGLEPVAVEGSGSGWGMRWERHEGEPMSELWARAEAEAPGFGVVVLRECYADCPQSA